MLRVIVVLILALWANSCEVKPNQKPIIYQPDPTLIREVDNGQKLLIGNLSDPEANYLYVAKLKGTPYQMGKAFGQLFS